MYTANRFETSLIQRVRAFSDAKLVPTFAENALAVVHQETSDEHPDQRSGGAPDALFQQAAENGFCEVVSGRGGRPIRNVKIIATTAWRLIDVPEPMKCPPEHGGIEALTVIKDRDATSHWIGSHRRYAVDLGEGSSDRRRGRPIVLDHRETHAQAAGNVMNIEDHKLSVIRDQLQINDVHGSAELAANPHPWWPSP